MKRKFKGKFKAKFVSFLTVFLMVLGLIIPAFSAPDLALAAGPTDIKGHWAENYISRGIQLGFINGYPDGTFLPDRPVSRAEFSKMVNAALGNSGTTTVSFADVPYYEWFYTDVSKAVAATYVAGYDDNTFLPNKAISRQEASVMLARIVPAYNSSVNLNAYSDKNLVADWASDYLKRIVGKGYMGAYDDGKLHPMDNLTRAQTAKILCDILDKETIVKIASTIKSEDDFKDRIYTNSVTLSKDLGEEEVSFSNCVFLGNLLVQGGSDKSVLLKNSRVASLSVKKTGSPVRVLAQGETTIVNTTLSEKCILETKSLAGGLFGGGFTKIDVGSKTEASFIGSFPLVTINGSEPVLRLESATVDKLTITSSGKKSVVHTDNKSTIKSALVSAAANFYGLGTINKMEVNANGITYETKPKAWTIGKNIDTPSQATPGLTVTFSPVDDKTGIALDVKPTITFNNAIETYAGKDITAAYLKENLVFKKGSSSGSNVTFSAAIDSARKVITLTPSSKLDQDTKYYLAFPSKIFRVVSDKENVPAKSLVFTTIDTTPKISFSPADGKINFGLAQAVTVTFSDAIYNSSGKTPDGTYLKSNITVTDKRTGTLVDLTPSISSNNKVATVSPPSDGWDSGGTYLVTVKGNAFKNSAGTYAKEASITFVAGTAAPELTLGSYNPDERAITIEATSTIAGDLYLIATSGSIGIGSLTATMIKSGKDPDGNTCPKLSASIGLTSKDFTISGLERDTEYNIYGVVYGNGTNSELVSKTNIKTLQAFAELESMSYEYEGGSGTISTSSSTSAKKVATGTAIVSIKALAKDDADILFDGTAITDNGTEDVYRVASIDMAGAISGGEVTVTLTVSKDGYRSRSFTVTFSYQE